MGGIRSRWAAIGAAVAMTLGGGGLLTTSASVGSGERGVYVPITPCRVMDTRPGPDNVGPRNTPIGPDETHTITVLGTNGNCTIPTDAIGLVMNVAVINPTRDSYLTVYPADTTRPLAASANWTAGHPPLSNAVTTDISTDGRIALYNLSGTVDLAADIVGYYIDHTHDDRYPTDAEVDTKIATAIAAAPAPTGAARVLVDATGDAGYWASIALTPAGNPVIASFDYATNDVRLALCSTPDCTGTTTIRTIETDAEAGQTAVVVPPDAIPAVVYARVPGEIVHAKCADATCSSTTKTTVAASGVDPAAVVGIDGYTFIAYHSSAGNDLRSAACVDALCTGSVQSTLDHQTGKVRGVRPSVALLPGGLPTISSFDDTDGTLRVSTCGNPQCSSGSTNAVVDSSVDAGSNTSIAVGTDATAVVSYGDATSHDVLFAKCNNGGCTNPSTLVTIESLGSVGYSTDIAIGADGYPIIAYLDETQGDLQIAKCGNLDCTGGISRSLVEGAGTVGYDASMVIDAHGAPTIAHRDASNGDLRVAKCATRTCLP